MSKATHVARGTTYGDVSNQAVRNILSEISKEIFGKFSDEKMKETMEYFDWCCPYTGEYLKDKYDKKTGDYATDHIYPQNRIWCGLNVLGNLVLVDKEANRAKGDQSVEDFLLNDTKVLGCLDDATRNERLQKIKDFQNKYGYDPCKIKATISGLLQDRYQIIRNNQETCKNEAIELLNTVGIQRAVASSNGAPKNTTRSVKTKETDAFCDYLTDVCGRTKNVASSYKSSRDKIMNELNIKDVAEFGVRIDEAEDYCKNKIDIARANGDIKTEKRYRDCRSAIRKYKEFIEYSKAQP